jgi:hypothetical protein
VENRTEEIVMTATGFDVETTTRISCSLCGDRHGRVREGRLGRYATTCDDCESRRGSHLVSTKVGYVSRAVWRPSFPPAG